MSFIDATRQNIRPLSSLKYQAGQNVSYDISRVGFLATVYLRFAGSVTAKHASKTTFTKAAEAPYNLANRIRLVLNNGVSVWDTSGYGCYLQNVINKINYNLDQAITGSKVFAFDNKCSSAGTKNDLNFALELNISINDKDLLGLLLLQSSQIVATVQIDNAQPGALTSDTDIDMTVEGNWHISYEYFDVPTALENYPVIDCVHQVLEDNNTIHSTGENRFVIPRGNTYLRIINAIQLNGSATLDNVEKMSLKYNLTNEPYNMAVEDFLVMQRRRYGRDLPAGVLVWDFFYQGLPNLGNQRDLVNSSNITEFDQFLTVASGATLGSNNNTMRTIRDMLVDVQPTA